MKKRKITLDDLASMTERGFEDIKANMATKHELFETREVLARAIKDLEGRFVAYAGKTRENIEERVSTLEVKRERK